MEMEMAGERMGGEGKEEGTQNAEATRASAHASVGVLELLALVSLSGYSSSTGSSGGDSSSGSSLRFVVSSVLASGSSSAVGRVLLSPLVDSGELGKLLEDGDGPTRANAASAAAKIALATGEAKGGGKGEEEEEDEEGRRLLGVAQGLLREEEEEFNRRRKEREAKERKGGGGGGGANRATPWGGADDHDGEEVGNAADRAVEVLAYLSSKTSLKDVLASGCGRSGSGVSGSVGERGGGSRACAGILPLLVSLARRRGISTRSPTVAYGLASVFGQISVSVEELRREAFRGKDVTEEQYDEMAKVSGEERRWRGYERN